MNYALWFAGSMALLAGFIGLALTHFGVVSGFRIISPILFGAALTLYAVAAGARHPIFLIAWMTSWTIFLELVYFFNLWGLSTVTAFAAGA